MGLYDNLPEKSYLKKLLIGVDSDFVEQFLQLKQNYETAVEKEDKRIFRDKMTGIFWELYSRIAQMINPELSTAKRLFLRYGLTDLRYLSPEDQKFILEKPIGTLEFGDECIFYADEWLQGVSEGKIKASTVDETNSKQDKNTHSSQNSGEKQDKFQSLLAVEKGRMENFFSTRKDLLKQLEQHIVLLQKEFMHEETQLTGIYNQEQNKALDDIIFLQKELKKINKDIAASGKTIRKAQESIDMINSENNNYSDNTSVSAVNKEKIIAEVGCIRQMAKMTIGRQGNMFPYLTSNFMPRETKDYLFKDIVKKKLKNWLTLDAEAFVRVYKGQEMNIAPYIILVPGYGLQGVCWEPLDPNNKQFGRGRMALPIFTRTPDVSILAGVGDIRWQAAKEIASYYWMEEGLTGRYYEYYLSAKLKGDLKSLFVKDYLLWMTKETQGVQKLEQDARYVFWRYVPLPDERKKELSKKGYYYNQLWEKEQVWRSNPNSK